MSSHAVKEEAFNACVDYMCQHGWGGFSFSKAANESGVSIIDIHNSFKVPADVIKHAINMIDTEMLKELEGEDFSDSQTREIILEILITRFEKMKHFKQLIKTVWDEWSADMLSLILIAQAGKGSISWILDQAGISTMGIKGLLRVHGLMVLYLLTVKEWLEDDSEDMSKTMAFLDRGLGKCERLSHALGLDKS